MPKRWTQKNVIPALMAGLAGVLLLLAALQYRWIGEISEADRNRLGRGLFVASEQFRRDFNRELSDIAANFPIRPPAVARGDWDVLAEDYARWADSSAAGARVAAVYIREPSSADQSGRTLKLDQAVAHFEQVDPPADVRALFDEWPQPPRGPRGAPINPRSAIWTFIPDGPALATPLLGGRGRERGRERGRGFSDGGRLLVVLDRAAILESLLPEINSRFVVADEVQLYQLAVVDAATSQLLFSNADIEAQAFLDAEGQVPLVYSGEELLARLAGRRGRRDRSGQSPPGPGPDRPGPDEDRFFPRAVVISAPDSPGWMLASRHSGGPLSAVVSSLRRRNLAISFGILLLLTVGMGLALLAARRAERLAQLQMEFVAGVSHELRTPIAVMRQAADNLAEGIVSSSEQTREYGRLIRSEGRRLTDMVEQTLQFASSQAGKQQYSIESLMPATLISQAIAAVESELSETGMEVNVEASDDLPAVTGDSTALTQCLRNLLSNAIKYRGDSTTIDVSASSSSAFVHIDVRDTGAGISAGDLPHVFEPFYRGRQAIDAQVKGSGLGLSLAKQAAEAAGGSLAVTSGLGVGSTFRLTLPIARDSEATN